MQKTVTLRVDEKSYNLIKTAADGQKRNLSNFIEFATLEYLASSMYVHDDEMNEIINDSTLTNNLKNGLKDLKNGDYTIV